MHMRRDGILAQRVQRQSGYGNIAGAAAFTNEGAADRNQLTLFAKG